MPKTEQGEKEWNAAREYLTECAREVDDFDVKAAGWMWAALVSHLTRIAPSFDAYAVLDEFLDEREAD